MFKFLFVGFFFLILLVPVVTCFYLFRALIRYLNRKSK